MNYPVLPCGDCAVTVQVGKDISEETNQKVVSLLQTLQEAAVPGVRELVPSYSAVCVHYDPAVLPYETLLDKLNALELKELTSHDASQEIVEIPVCYGGEYGPDLDFVAQHNGLSPEEVVAIHSGGTYLVYMLGFLPGFVYLGGLDKRICVPRLETPRTRIEPGSVGIGGSQTGVYPVASPGGWRILGRTYRKFYDPARKEPILCKAGQYIRFVPITAEEYEEGARKEGLL